MNRFGEQLLHLLTIIVSISLSQQSFAISITPVLPKDGVVTKGNNKFIDPNVDYSRFVGRVTDKDDSGRILKVKTENNNSKFLKAGDLVYFKVNNQDRGRFCKASVRTIENFYFSMYVQDFSACWDMSKYFLRGLQLNFKSELMEHRVFEASKYREILILRKEGYLSQLSGINHFLWTYDQQKLKTAAEYDKRVNEIIREKQLALDNLIQTKQENLLLQTEIVMKLDSLDESLDHYKVERQEYLTDRWNMDHTSGKMPFSRRPLKLKNK
jgi:hypothetical protein